MSEQGVSRITHRACTGLYYEGLPIHAAPGVHEDAIALLLDHLRPPARILELGAGSGAFTKRLLAAGFDVEAADLDPTGWPHEHVPLHVVDLNTGPWPFADAAYDGIVAVEVIEHLENPSSFLRNARRHLRPGGTLLLTTPNVVSLASRRALLLRGTLAFFGPGVLFSAGHRSILPWWLLSDLLRAEGWDLVELAFIGRQPFVLLPGRPWWKRLATPLVDLALLAVGRSIPREAALAAAVAVVARPEA
jgi:SAM-dependent methyltransferase